jgi:hypothetical protein
MPLCYRVYRHAPFQVSVMSLLQLPEGKTPHDLVVVVIVIFIAMYVVGANDHRFNTLLQSNAFH